jgi:hypothetical protein
MPGSHCCITRPAHQAQALRTSFGSLAIFTVIRRASSGEQFGTKKERDSLTVPFHCCTQLALGYDRRGRRRSFSLADAERPTSVLRTASDAKESQCRCRE